MRLHATTLFIFWLLFSTLAQASDDKISVQQAYQLALDERVVLIDIRAEQEWRQTGVAPMAKTISMHQEGGIPAFEKELLQLLKGDKNQPIALICAGGVRSNRLQAHLQAQGFSQVFDVKEGMLGGWLTKGWIDNELPVVTFQP